jgi:hypothetical protein
MAYIGSFDLLSIRRGTQAVKNFVHFQNTTAFYCHELIFCYNHKIRTGLLMFERRV